MANTFSFIHVHHIYSHDDVIKWKPFLCFWLFVWGIHRLPVISPHKCQWRGVFIFSLICTLNNREVGDLWCHCAHYDVIVMLLAIITSWLYNCDIILDFFLHFAGQMNKSSNFKSVKWIIWNFQTVPEIPSSYGIYGSNKLCFIFVPIPPVAL